MEDTLYTNYIHAQGYRLSKQVMEDKFTYVPTVQRTH